jgi:galacturonosyltransferase
MNKAVVLIGNNSSGMYDFRHELIARLVNGGCKVTVLTPFDTKVDELNELGINLIETPLNRRGLNPAEDLKLLYLYKKLLKELKPDLVVGYTIKPNIYAGFAGRIMKIPYAANITGLGSTFQKDGALKRVIISMYKISLKNAKVVFFENEENRRVFIESKIVDEDKTCLLSGAGVNLEHFGVLDYPKGEVTKFLFIGRIMREKGVDELFAAMKRLRADGVNCMLDVLGGFDEDYRGKIKKHESEGWLIYHGYQPDVRPFIAESHCFVLPSWHEGMANTNLECAASGRPVITSNIHGCMEAVEDGVSGYLCERKNADDLYRVMKKFTELFYEERRAMGLAGRKRMEEMFDKKKVIEETIRELQKSAGVNISVIEGT